MPATESADNDVEGRLSFREGILPFLALNLRKPPLPPPAPLLFPFFPFAPSGKLLTSGMPELRLFKVNSSAEESAEAEAVAMAMPPPLMGVDGEKCMHAPSPAPGVPPKDLDDVEDGRFRPNLAPMRLSIRPLLPPRVGVVFFCFFFFPPKPIAADTDVAAAVAAADEAVAVVVGRE
jgi:hypothetical protein